MIGEAVQANDLSRLVERFEGLLIRDRDIDAGKRDEVIHALRAWLSDRSDSSKGQLLASIGSLHVVMTRSVATEDHPSAEVQWLERRAADASTLKRKQAVLKERLAVSIERRSQNTGSVHYLRSKPGDPKFPSHSTRRSRPATAIKIDEPRFISTDYDERFEFSRPGSVVPKAHSHSACYHDQDPSRGRSGYYAKTSRYQPLTREEYRMLKHGDFMHCHYRHEFSPDHINAYILKSKADFKAEKAAKLKAEEEKENKKKRVEEYSKTIKMRNKGVTKKEFEPAVNMRFVAGVAEPPRVKRAIKPEERRVASSQDKRNYLTPKQKLSDDPEIDKDKPISIYFLKQRQEQEKKERAEAEQKKAEERRKLEESKKQRREKVHALALSKGVTEEQLRNNKFKLLEQERVLKEKKEKQLLKKKLKDINLKAREEIDKSKRNPLMVDLTYVFNTTLDAPKQDVSPTVKDDLKMKAEQFKQEKARAASADYKRITIKSQENRRSKTREQRKVHFEPAVQTTQRQTNQQAKIDDEQGHYQVMTHSVEVKQRSTLLDAERGMLEEINDSIRKTQLHVDDSQREGEFGIEGRDFNDHLIIDPREATENEFFGLRPNPNLKQTTFKLMKGPPTSGTKGNYGGISYGKVQSKLKKSEDVILPKGKFRLM